MSERLAALKSNIVSKNKSLLQLARQRAGMNCEELKDLLFEPGNFNKYVKPNLDFLQQNRHIFTHHNLQSHSLDEQRREAAKMLLQLRKFWKIDMINDPFSLIYIVYAIGMFDGGLSTKSLLQYFLYAKSLLIYESNPKHRQFYERAMRGQDLGCFGLTQFHHGSYSKGIETIATYDPKTQQFILSTQGTKGMKFWIGALAEVANVMVIWAQLIINGKSQGPHPFYLKIRCPKTHKALKGITIGDCGPKKGLNYIDNGFIILEDVRVPKENLLGKFGYVNEQDKYISPIKSIGLRFGLHMSALSAGRGFLSIVTNVTSLNALTIALRYSHSRKQFQNKHKNDQIPIIQYALTKIRLIPHIATHIIQIPAGNQIALVYSDEKLLFSDQLFVNQMHAISAAVKARSTWNSIHASSECRTILGGHGYSALSRIPSIIDDIQINSTWQGDNNMLLQQTSKYLMKVIATKTKTKILDLAFVHQKHNINLQTIEDNLRNVSNLEELFKDLFRVKYTIALSKTKELSKLYKDKEEAQYHFHPQAGNSLSLTFADYYTFTVGKAKVAAAKSSEVKQFLQKCLYLWAITLLQSERYGSHDLRKALQKQIIALCDELVDSCVVATDALAPSSFVIGSPFADFNGDGFKEYLNILYTKKDTFTRSHYYEDIKNANFSNQ